MNIEKLKPSQKGSGQANRCVCVPHYLFAVISWSLVLITRPKRTTVALFKFSLNVEPEKKR